jgi:hypothetical protein
MPLPKVRWGAADSRDVERGRVGEDVLVAVGGDEAGRHGRVLGNRTPRYSTSSLANRAVPPMAPR